VFGELTNPALATIVDMDNREILIFAPLILATLVLGFQPGLVFDITNASTVHLVDAFRAATGR
jgi:NADH-quinone oxidoreductase subunit M